MSKKMKVGLRRYLNGDIVVVLGAGLAGAAYLGGVIDMPRATVSDPLGPAAFPTLLSILLLLGAGVQALEIMLKPSKPEEEAAPSQPAVDPIVGVGVASLIVFAMVFEVLGFIVAMSLLMVILTTLLDRRRWRLNIVTSLGFSSGVYLLFSKVLGVTLPGGILPL